MYHLQLVFHKEKFVHLFSGPCLCSECSWKSWWWRASMLLAPIGSGSSVWAIWQISPFSFSCPAWYVHGVVSASSGSVSDCIWLFVWKKLITFYSIKQYWIGKLSSLVCGCWTLWPYICKKVLLHIWNSGGVYDEGVNLQKNFNTSIAYYDDNCFTC